MLREKMIVDKLYKLRNTIQPYAWGSRRMLAEFLNREVPSAGPEAELWMGAHPKAPSCIRTSDGWVGLDKAIERQPDGFLGFEVRSRYGPRLPFLFKVLAIDRPLSLQAHPDRQQALEGYRRENEMGIALQADQRSYKDEHHKPECICALTPFWALCGFREPDDARRLLEPLWPSDQRSELGLLTQGWGSFYEFLVTLEPSRQRRLCTHAALRASQLSGRSSEFDWVEKLHREHPGDIGVLAPAMLNLIRLEPDEALFLPAGQLHAYLEGMGIELMANSDNVLRGGLTRKHIDVPELTRILEFRPSAMQVLTAQRVGASEQAYPSPADEFRLSKLHAQRGGVLAVNSWGPEIVLCARGSARIDVGDGSVVELNKGESVFIPAMTNRYRVSGSADLFRATVNLRSS